MHGVGQHALPLLGGQGEDAVLVRVRLVFRPEGQPRRRWRQGRALERVVQLLLLPVAGRLGVVVPRLGPRRQRRYLGLAAGGRLGEEARKALLLLLLAHLVTGLKGLV